MSKKTELYDFIDVLREGGVEFKGKAEKALVHIGLKNLKSIIKIHKDNAAGLKNRRAFLLRKIFAKRHADTFTNASSDYEIKLVSDEERGFCQISAEFLGNR